MSCIAAKKHNVQYIINLGRYPSKLEMSIIVLVFKSDDKTDPDPKYLDCQTLTGSVKGLCMGE